MSLHLIECVRPLTDLLPSEKLALLAFADSADSDTQISWPGIEAVGEWAGVSTSRAKALVKSLVDRGLLHRTSSGHHGRRARYLVFPGGCCSEHPRARATVEATSPAMHAEAVEQLAARLGLPVADVVRALEEPIDGLGSKGAKGAAGDTQPATEGSRAQSSVSVEGSRAQHPSPDPTPVRVPPAAPNTVEGYCLGTAGSTRSSGTTTTPPTPHASGAGGAGCALHTPDVAENCRGCGTTRRQLSRAATRAAAEHAAAGAGPRCPGGFRWLVDDSCGCAPPVTHPTRVELETAVAS